MKSDALPSPAASNPRPIVLRAAVAIALALFGTGTFALARGTHAEASNSPDISAPSDETVKPLPAKAPLPTAQEDYLGVILARASADVAPRFEGKWSEVLVRLGDRVKAGDPIAKLDAPSLGFELRAAEASLENAGAEAAFAAVELDQTAERLERRRALSAESLVTGEELSMADYQKRLAAAKVKATRAKLAERHAEVERLRKDNIDVVVRAPFDGIVAARYADPGANASPSKPIVRLISADDLFVRFAVPEGRAALLSTGKNVSVRVGERPFEARGSIDRIAPEVDPSSRMVFVEARLQGVSADAGLLSGVTARVSLDAAR